MAPVQLTQSTPLGKITPPRLGTVALRHRLFRKFDSAPQLAGWWVSGPPGSGKSTLVASYLRHTGETRLWYQLDSGDADIAGFFIGLRQAAIETAGEAAARLPLFSFEYALGADAFARNFFSALYELLPRPFSIVLDNVQDATASGPIHELVRDGVELVPDGGRFFMLSREALDPRYARLRANGLLAVLGWDDLRLDAEEFAQVVALKAGGAKVTDAASEELRAQLQGWVAGLILSIEQMSAAPLRTLALDKAVPEATFDYLASELLDRADEETRHILLQTSVLTWMSPKAVRSITGRESAEALLAELSRRNLFVSRHTEQQDVYQYHPLLRRFLLSRLEAESSEEARRELMARAVRVMEDEGDVDAAVELLQRAGCWSDLAGLIAKSAQQLAMDGRGQTLAGWISALPAPVIEQVPWLQYWLGVCLMGVDPQRSLVLFQGALALFRERGDPAGAYLAWVGAVESVRFDLSGSHKRFDAWLEDLERLREQFPQCPSPEVELRVSQACHVPMDWRQPWHPQRHAWRDRMVELSEASGNRSLLVDSLARVVLSEVTHGSMRAAAAKYAVLEPLLREGGVSAFAQTGALTWMSLYHLVAGNLEQCAALATEGLELAARTGSHYYDMYLLFNLGIAASHSGNVKHADEMANRMAARMEATGSFGAHFLHQLRVAIALQRGEFPLALGHAEECLRTADACGFPFLEVWALVTRATARAEAGLYGESRADLERAFAVAPTLGSKWEHCMCLCGEAFLLLREGKLEAANAKLRDALAFGRGEGLAVCLVRPANLALCEQALREGIEADHALKIIRALGGERDRAPRDLEAWPWELRIRAFGHFEVIRHGEPLRFSGKAPKKPLELLKAIVALGGQRVPESHLIDALWPDAEGDGGRTALNTTLHRLRGLIGFDVVQVSDSRIGLDPKRCWIDLWAFGDLIGRCESALAASRLEAADTSLAKAMNLYVGEIMSGDEGMPTVLGCRNRADTAVAKAIRPMAQALEKCRDWAGAARWYERALEISPAAEEFYRLLLRTYGYLGEQAAVETTLRRCREALARHLGTTPSAATEAAYRSAKAG